MIKELLLYTTLAAGDGYSTQYALKKCISCIEVSPVKNVYLQQTLYVTGSMIIDKKIKSKKGKIIWKVVNIGIKSWAIQHNMRIKK
jgi:hypothetical protein